MLKRKKVCAGKRSNHLLVNSADAARTIAKPCLCLHPSVKASGSGLSCELFVDRPGEFLFCLEIPNCFITAYRQTGSGLSYELFVNRLGNFLFCPEIPNLFITGAVVANASS